MHSVVPDRIEPVVAYRLWDIYESSPYTLKSYGWSTIPWPYRKVLEAFHDGFRDDKNISHSIDKCPGAMADYMLRCGIYGTKSHFPDGFNLRGVWGLAGQVYLWGLIVELELGYRAQYAYPKCLYLDGKKNDVIEMIANNYRIPAAEPPVAERRPHFQALADIARVQDAISRDTGVQG